MRSGFFPSLGRVRWSVPENHPLSGKRIFVIQREVATLTVDNEAREAGPGVWLTQEQL